MRDQVIERVKDTFQQANNSDFPSSFDGEITVIATGSS